MEVAIFGATACAAVFAQYAFIRCGLHGSFTSASWPEATLPDVQNITRVSNLVLSVYERDLTEPRFSDAVPPARVVKSVSYDDTRGQCPPYTVFLDPDAKDVCVAIRGLHLTHEADYAVLLNNRTGQQRLEEGYAHKGLLQAAQWLLEREAETLKELLQANPGFSLTLSGHSLGSGIASLLAILLASSPDRIGTLPPGKLHCLAFAPPRVVSLNLAVKYSDVITSVVLQGVLAKCRGRDDTGERCAELSSMGMGVPYHSKKPEYAGVAHWWRTSLYNAELLLHHRLRNHLCLTPHPSQAHLFYVPFYPGLQLEHVLGFSNSTIDEYYDDLARWIRRQPAFKRYGAKDHFFGLGRTTWLFRRSLSPVLDGANLEQMPEFMPMMKLEVERYAWDDQDSFGLPFPTDFHPISSKQLRRWQATVRSAKRPYQFACIIPPDSKEPEAATKTRAAVVQQCQAPSTSCALLNCSRGDCSHEQVMDLYLSAQYAVQDGSNFGLRYLMDSLVAGAVPVMLWNRTYALYQHHFPSNPDSFSVYLPYIDVPEWTTVEHRLSKVAPARYRALQLQVIHMIPSLIYVDPSHVLSNVRDAVDIAIDHMVDLWRDRKARHEYPVPSTAAEPAGTDTETKEEGRGKRLADATLSELSGGGEEIAHVEAKESSVANNEG
ncbi:unnamed protein product [Closterium sp. Naga37s-1]|nr:unnamed protein product [Closterium sp. Naga37s-1]